MAKKKLTELVFDAKNKPRTYDWTISFFMKHGAFSVLPFLSGCLGIDHLLTREDAEVFAPSVHDTEDTATEDLVCFWTDSFTQMEESEYKYDVVVAVDTSLSMSNDRERVRSGLEDILLALPPENWKFVLISADADVARTDSQAPFTPGATMDDILQRYDTLDGYLEQGLGAISIYIQENDTAHHWLRKKAALLSIVISDENDYSAITVNDFEQWYEGLREDMFFSSVVHLSSSSSCYNPADDSEVGTDYIQTARYFDGALVDICFEDWTMAVEDLSTNVDGHDSLALTYAPVISTIAVLVDEVSLPRYAWSYGAAKNSVLFTPAPEPGVLVNVSYQIDPETIDECPLQDP